MDDLIVTGSWDQNVGIWKMSEFLKWNNKIKSLIQLNIIERSNFFILFFCLKFGRSTFLSLISV